MISHRNLRAALQETRTSSTSVTGLLKLNMASSVMVDIPPPLQYASNWSWMTG
ncbi:hypothetical protein [Massilia sp. MP_M2]|uniref:hypothetical protein n=1 Tax=Massilia sp. MP_M2 TaxID=3071713 RepID=UPI00319D940F